MTRKVISLSSNNAEQPDATNQRTEPLGLRQTRYDEASAQKLRKALEDHRAYFASLTQLSPKPRPTMTFIPAAHGYAFTVKAGQKFRIIDLYGAQVVDFMAWCHPYKASTCCEHFSASYTRYRLRDLAGPLVNDCLYTNKDRPMFRITADTVKTHDLLFMACNPGFYEQAGEKGHRNCAENIQEAMKKCGCEMESWNQVHDPFNVFQNTPYYSLGARNCSKAGDYIEFECLMDSVVGLSCCPFTGGGFNGGRITDVAVEMERGESHST